MPFELGLAAAVSLHHSDAGYQWRILERVTHRLTQSLSDVAGYDPSIYGGTVKGTLEVLLDIFDNLRKPPLKEVDDLLWVYRRVRRFRGTQPANVYRSNSYRRLVLAARGLVLKRAEAIARL